MYADEDVDGMPYRRNWSNEYARERTWLSLIHLF